VRFRNNTERVIGKTQGLGEDEEQAERIKNLLQDYRKMSQKAAE